VKIHAHYLAAIEQPLVVLLLAEEIKLLVLAVPVAPDALEDGGPVMNGVSHNAYPGFSEGNYLVFKKGIGWHDKSSFPDNSYQLL
jgi:hypothetical protein